MTTEQPRKPDEQQPAEPSVEVGQIEESELSNLPPGGNPAAQEPQGSTQILESAEQQTSRPVPEARERRHPTPAEADVTLDERGLALSSLLRQTLDQYQPQMSAVVGDVVATVEPHQVFDAAQKLRDDPETACDYLRCLSVVDYEDRFEVLYHLFSLKKTHRFVLKVNLPYDDPRIDSVISLWAGADWYEREAHDLFGVVFDGHPDLAPLLLWEGFEGFPGRKSYPFNDYQEW